MVGHDCKLRTIHEYHLIFSVFSFSFFRLYLAFPQHVLIVVILFLVISFLHPGRVHLTSESSIARTQYKHMFSVQQN